MFGLLSRLTRRPRSVLIATAACFVLAEVVDRSAPALAPNLIVVVTAADDAGLTSPAAAAAGERVTAALAEHDDVTGVQSWFRTRLPMLVSADGRSAIVSAHLTGDEFQIAQTLVTVRPQLNEVAGAAVELEFAGSGVLRETVDATVMSDLLRAELIALPITFVILLWVFGGFWASLVPLVIAGFAIVSTNAVLRGLAELTDVSIFALNLSSALGFGLAIDYALLMVRRYREEVSAGRPRRRALEVMIATAGRTVAFSGLTVAVSLSAMLLFPTYYLRSFAYAGISVVLMSMVGALVVAPALLAVLGRRVGRGRHLRRKPVEVDPLSGRWARLALWGSRHARLVGPTSVLVLIALAWPFASVNFGATDERALPPGAPVRVTSELIQRDFPHADVPFAILVLGPGADPGALAHGVGQVDGVEAVQPITAGDGTSLLLVHSGVEPSTGAGEEIVRDLRAVVGEDARVGGPTASFLDTREAIADRAPLAVGLVIVAVLLLMLMLTGTLLLPLLAVFTNGLSLTALFGAIVLVFQEGHLSGLLGFTPTGKIEVALPLLMACIAFGLSMDYGMFLLARVMEEWRACQERGEPAAVAVAIALQKTGGVITAAALILATVLLAMGTSQISSTKMMGLGVALAVLMDALFVRVWVVPALLQLFGPATWWAPAWLRRWHRRFGWHEEQPDGAGSAAESAPDFTPRAVVA